MINKVLNEEINWLAFYVMVNETGVALNERMFRMMKGFKFETMLELLSQGNIKYVDQIGCDHHLTHDNKTIRIETKYWGNSLSNDIGVMHHSNTNKTKTTCDIKLNNKLGKDKGINLDATFDYLMIIGHNAAGIVPYQLIIDNDDWLENTGEGLYVKIPYSQITMINEHSLENIKSISNKCGYKPFDLKDTLKEAYSKEAQDLTEKLNAVR